MRWLINVICRWRINRRIALFRKQGWIVCPQAMGPEGAVGVPGGPGPPHIPDPHELDRMLSRENMEYYQ